MCPLAPPVTFCPSVSRVPSGRQNQKLYRAVPAKNPRNEMLLPVTVWSIRLSPPVNDAPGGAGCTQGALDGLAGGRTRTVTASATLSCVPSLTVSENTRSVRTEGAVKDGAAEAASSSATVSPAVCVQA